MKDLSKAEKIKPLNDYQVKQKEYLLSQYPQLDELMIDTILRMKPEQVDSLVYQVKEGTLKHEEPLKPEDYIIKSVSIE